MGRALAVLHRLHGQVQTAGAAVATRPDAGQVGLAISVGDDAATLQVQSRLGQHWVAQLLADGLEHHVGFHEFGLSGGLQLAVDHGLVGKRHAGGMTVLADHFDRRQPVADGDAVGLRPVLLFLRRRHGVRSAPVNDVHALGTQQAGLNSGIDRCHAAADHHHAAPDRQCRKIFALAQAGDEVHRVFHARQVFARHAERLGGGQAHAQEHSRVVLAQRRQRRTREGGSHIALEHSRIVLAQGVDFGLCLQLPVVADLNAADGQQPRQFALGEVVGRLV